MDLHDDPREGPSSASTATPAPLEADSYRELGTLLKKAELYSQMLVESIQTEQAQTMQLEFPEGCALRDYQSVAVTWLEKLYRSGLNGILADEMGLGKTVTTIALLTFLWRKKIKGPYCVVVPLSTLENWRKEFERWAPHIPVWLYHGDKTYRSVMQARFINQKKRHGVLLTSFEIAMREQAFLKKQPWKYLVVDEAHRLKNFDCRLVRELKKFPTEGRLLLTGTPLQNNLKELWSLLNFTVPDVFSNVDQFESWFEFGDVQFSDQEVAVDGTPLLPAEKVEAATGKTALATDQQKYIVSVLRRVLRPFMLRRMKEDAGVALPPKREVVLYCTTTPKQRERYEALRTRMWQTYVQKQEGRTAGSVLNLVMQLRKLCNHPFLFQEFDPFVSRTEAKMVRIEEDVQYNFGNEKYVMKRRRHERVEQLHEAELNWEIPEDREIYRQRLVDESGKFALLNRILPTLRAAGHRVLLFSQMTSLMDLLEDFLVLLDIKWERLDGTTPRQEREASIERFNADDSIFLFLLSTRAGGLGINLTGADTVIIYDSDWNPQVDRQAQDRCHRIGQSKPVVVYRLITAQTVESYLLRRATDKQRLESVVIAKGRFDRNARQAVEADMEAALALRPGDVEVDAAENVLTEEGLAKVLDRSYVMGLGEEEPQEKRRKGEGGGEVPPTGKGFEVIEELGEF